LENADTLKDEQLEENQATLKQLVQALMSEEASDYIFKFLVEYSYATEE
jgi:hypothetical protein